jgi:hypothetical protein
MRTRTHRERAWMNGRSATWAGQPRVRGVVRGAWRALWTAQAARGAAVAVGDALYSPYGPTVP